MKNAFIILHLTFYFQMDLVFILLHGSLFLTTQEEEEEEEIMFTGCHAVQSRYEKLSFTVAMSSSSEPSVYCCAAMNPTDCHTSWFCFFIFFLTKLFMSVVPKLF